MDVSNYVTERSRAVEWSGIRVMFALADETPDVVNLGIGQPDFDINATDFDDLARQCTTWLNETANVRVHRITRQRPVDRFEEERSHLFPLPAEPFDNALEDGLAADR